jgi:hypothetical protein
VLNKPTEVNEQGQPVISHKEREKANVSTIRAITFGLKVFEEIVQAFCVESTQQEVREFIVSNVEIITHVTCLACEQNEQVIKN